MHIKAEIMKKRFGFMFAFLFTIAIAVAFFVGASNLGFEGKSEQALADDSEVTYNQIFDYVSITQEDYVFSNKDLIEVETAYETYNALYTNKTVTIACNYEFTSVYDEFTISVNSSYLEDDDEHIVEIGGKRYYVFSINDIEEDTSTRIVLRVRLYNPPTPNNPQVTYTEYSLSFMLIQTKLTFVNNSDFSWQYTYNTVLETVSAPSTNYTYPPIVLSVPNGTRLNPVYVKFIYCGETFEVYNVDGIFYNAVDNSTLDFSTLSFNKSGTYEVEIYDNTSYSGYANNNYRSYSFIVKNTTTALDAFYIIAHLEDGSLIMNKQISNTTTTVEFVNLADIASLVDRIVVTMTYRPTGGENISETTEYNRSNLPASLTFENDDNYHIQVIGRNGGNIIAEFEFNLIQSIRSYFESGGVRYEIADDEPSNTTKTFHIDVTETSYYNGIEGASEYSFYVIIARSEPSIDGINNNARTSNNVSLTVRGVGTIEVAISKDGTTNTIVCQNGERLPTFADPGRYFIRITDEMGTTITKSFTITVRMNTAAIILIVIAAVIMVVLVVFIFISRTRVKVR